MLTPAERKTVLATPEANCKACRSLSQHTPVDWLNHPFAGHGYVSESGWSHELLNRAEPRKSDPVTSAIL